MSETCALCRFAEPFQHTPPGKTPKATCRRYAPKPSRGDDGDGVEDAACLAVWPAVFLAYDWCGEFKPNPDEAMRAVKAAE